MSNDNTSAAATTEPPPEPSRRPKMESAIAVRGLQHFFGEGDLRKQVLFDNTLDVAPGEIVIMTGPSGSGKTTLLTLIGTLRTVQEGSLKVLGHELCGASPAQRLAVRRELGFIFQAHNLFESLTAFQNVRMAMELFGWDAARMKKRAVEMLEKLDLGHRVHYKPGELSGGQKQRVAIARGMAHRPKLILADEPTAALDEKTGRKVVTLFQELASEHQCTVLMVTHDNRILDVADRIVNMVDGRIKSNVLVEESSLICEFLHDCEVFAKLTPKTLSETADQMRREEFPAGTVIFRQNDPGEKFYLVKTGAVDVIREQDGSSNVIATLGKGSFFGEAALLTGEPRNATIKTRKPTEVYTLTNEQFQAVLQASATLEEELRKVLFQRQ